MTAVIANMSVATLTVAARSAPRSSRSATAGRGVRRELDEERHEERALERDDAEAVGEDGQRQEAEAVRYPVLTLVCEARPVPRLPHLGDEGGDAHGRRAYDLAGRSR